MFGVCPGLRAMPNAVPAKLRVVDYLLSSQIRVRGVRPANSPEACGDFALCCRLWGMSKGTRHFKETILLIFTGQSCCQESRLTDRVGWCRSQNLPFSPSKRGQHILQTKSFSVGNCKLGLPNHVWWAWAQGHTQSFLSHLPCNFYKPSSPVGLTGESSPLLFEPYRSRVTYPSHG